MSKREGFSQCLVDGDEQSLERARRLRQKALHASIVVEAALVLALLLWPLITLGKLPRAFFITPAPPYHGGPAAAPGPSHGHSTRPDGPPKPHEIMVQPPSIPFHVLASPPDEAPGISSGPGFGPTDIPGGASGPGQSRPGGRNFGPATSIPPAQAAEKP